MHRILFLLAAISFALTLGTAHAQPVPIANASFEEGDAMPDGWTLSGREGALSDRAGGSGRSILLTGSGVEGDSSYFRTQNLPLEPFTVYRMQFRGRRVGGEGGCPISGPVFCNRDLSMDMVEEWNTFTAIFITPSTLKPDESWLRFGQWHVTGTVAFDDITLAQATPVYQCSGSIELGEGEAIEGETYSFRAPLSSLSANHSRTLARHSCYFNTPRWVFGADSEVVYRQALPGVQQTEAEVEVEIGHYTGGELVVEVGPDGETWTALGSLGGKGTATFEVPDTLLPAAEVWVRLSAQAKDEVGTDSDPGSFQIYGYSYRSTLDAAPGDLRGQTVFFAETRSDERLDVHIESLVEGTPGNDAKMMVSIDNRTDGRIRIKPTVTVRHAGGEANVQGTTVVCEPGKQIVEIPYSIAQTGPVVLTLEFGKGSDFRAEATFHVASLFDTSYGEALDASDAVADVWWASSGHKISRSRPAPKTKGRAVRITMAKNEVDAAQIVIRPKKPLSGFSATAGVLTGPGKARIPAEDVELLRVGYVNVSRPTDQMGVAAAWPDPLPPFAGPIDVPAEKNQPIWIRVKASRDTPAGTYEGSVRLAADDYSVDVPLEVEVFDFVLPDRMTLSTAFGLNPGRVFWYHNLKTPEQQRAVYDKYLATHSAHHISPYDPAPLDHFRVEWPGQGQWSGGFRDRTEKHSGVSSVRIADDSVTGNAMLSSINPVAIPEEGLRLRFWFKTMAPGHRFNTVLSHRDAGGTWIYGKNRDMFSTGTGEWQQFDQTVTQFPEGAATVSAVVFGAAWLEDGSTTGTVWVDDLAVENAQTGETILRGDFEPLETASFAPQFDWTAWDAAMERAIDEYHFNAFTIPIQGMGGRGATNPNLLGYPEGTPEYQQAFTAYCQAVESHLREKGWLDEAFVYWFDEPEEKDYEFVMNGFHKIRSAAPGIRRMLTEQVEPELVGGPTIWCPLSAWMDLDACKEQQAKGDQLWWYVCTAPKAPYATLFIDHPATELRVWIWQAWTRGIDGILIWETNYWHSSAAYPDPKHPQNPYEDPMGWVEGYSVQAGDRMAWGNGDGRFVYPPEAAASGRPEQPVLDAPVDSIRFEMLRDGIEDFEYLAILKRLLAERGDTLSKRKRQRYEALLTVPEAISATMTQFTTDPAPIEKRREAIARTIEELSRD